jgi:hypothetical protein
MKRQLPQQTSHIIKPNLKDDKSAPANIESQLPSEIDNCIKSDQNYEKLTAAITVKKLKILKKTKVKKQGPDLRQVSNVDQHQTEASFDGKPDSKDQNCSLKTTSKNGPNDQNCTTSKPDSKDQNCTTSELDLKDQNCSRKTTSKTNSNEMASSGEKICLWIDQKGQV